MGVGAVGSGASQRTFKDVLLLPPPLPSARQSLPRPPHRPKFAVVQRPGTVRRPVPDREGWVRVEPRRRQLPPSPPSRRSIPEDLRGRCFNCLASSHRAADCRRSVRCFKCWGFGHRAVQCKVRAAQVIKSSVSVWDRLGPKLVHKPLDSPKRAMEWRRVSLPTPAIQRSGVADPTLGGTKKRRHRTRGRRPKTAPVAPSEDSREVAPPPGSSSPEPVRVHAPQPVVPDMVEATHLCILDRADALAREELRLRRCALFVVVTGSRPRVAAETLADEVAAGFGLDASSFSVHRSYPEDFVLILNSEELANQVYNNGAVFNSLSGSFKFLRWSRLAHAEVVAFPSPVLVEFKGIPIHAWDLATAQNLLRDHCTDVELHPDTVNRHDFSSFKVFGWCRRPHLIPNLVELLVPEPLMMTPGSTALERRLLAYQVTALVSLISPPVHSAAAPPSPAFDDDQDNGPRRRRLNSSVQMGHAESGEALAARRPVRERLGVAPVSVRHVEAGLSVKDSAPSVALVTGDTHTDVVEPVIGCMDAGLSLPLENVHGPGTETLEIPGACDGPGGEVFLSMTDVDVDSSVLAVETLSAFSSPSPSPSSGPAIATRVGTVLKPSMKAVGAGLRRWPCSPIKYFRRKCRGAAASQSPLSAAQSATTADFIARVSRPAARVLCGPQKQKRQRRPRAPCEGALPRRSRRLAGADVEKVMAPAQVSKGKWRIANELGLLGGDPSESLSLEVLDNYAKVFGERLTDLQVKALAALFNWTVPEDLQGAVVQA